MKDKIQICSLLLTRRCNLRCSYCRIVRNYQMPPEYPLMKHYIDNEMNTAYVIETLRRLHLHNPDMFFIIYGGEPFLRNDLREIILFCNSLGIHYTIITNGSSDIHDNIISLTMTEEVKGLTMSVDPMGAIGHQKLKSATGMDGLMEFKELVPDVVAEITVGNSTINNLKPLLQQLTENGINSDITFVDIAKSPYYDFSEVTDPGDMVRQTRETAELFQDLMSSDLNIHMKETLLPAMFNILPAKLDCGIERDFHNITIDADGSVRLCLRIRGVKTPEYGTLHYISPNGNLAAELIENIAHDKEEYCKGCNWTCMLMSKLLYDGNAHNDDLLHSSKRR